MLSDVELTSQHALAECLHLRPDTVSPLPVREPAPDPRSTRLEAAPEPLALEPPAAIDTSTALPTRSAGLEPAPRMFPTEWAEIFTFKALIQHSTRWLNVDPFARAADAALAANDRIDMSRVRDDIDAVTAQGLLPFLAAKQATIKECVQPDIEVLVPLPTGDTTPPYPAKLGLASVNTFHAGAEIQVPHPLPPQGPLPVRTHGEHRAIERHVNADYNKGLVSVLPRTLAEEQCTSAGIQLRISRCFIQRKVDIDPVKAAMGRKCDDYTASGINSREKAAYLAEVYGKYNDPTKVALAQTFLNAKKRFPNEAIVIGTSDFTAYYHRFLIAVHQVPLLATLVVIDGAEYVVLPLVGPFGLQDSNAMAKCTTEMIHAINCSRQMATWGTILSTIYVDDGVFFAPAWVMALLFEDHEVTSDMILGPNSISKKKTLAAPVRDALGFRFDCPAETVGLTPTWFEKLVAAVYLELPEQLRPGAQFPLQLLQRVAAHMIRTAEVVVAMRPFSFGIYRAIAGVLDTPRAKARLTRDAIVDINEWRRFLRGCWSDPSPLRVHMSVLPLVHRAPNEDRAALWTRQAAAAHTVIFVDACTTRPDVSTPGRWGAGWVTFGPPAGSARRPALAYGSYDISPITAAVVNLPDADANMINIYEFLASLIALDELARRGRPADLMPGAVWHVHVWTDNTSALAWLTAHKSSHPLVVHLLRELVHLQTASGLLVTMGHWAGRNNTLADDASRGFATPSGSQSLITLSHLVALRTLPPWFAPMLLPSQPLNHSPGLKRTAGERF